MCIYAEHMTTIFEGLVGQQFGEFIVTHQATLASLIMVSGSTDICISCVKVIWRGPGGSTCVVNV